MFTEHFIDWPEKDTRIPRTATSLDADWIQRWSTNPSWANFAGFYVDEANRLIALYVCPKHATDYWDWIVATSDEPIVGVPRFFPEDRGAWPRRPFTDWITST